MEIQRALVVPVRTTEINGLPALPDMQIEVHAIATCTIATILAEPVEWLDIMSALLDGKEYNIIHIGGHLTDDGLILATETISIDGLVMMFRGSPEHRQLIIFNTCNSESAARRIASNTPCAVIGTIGELDDRAAVAFAVKFYSSLRNEQIENFRQAFDASVGDKKKFIYVDGSGKSTEDEDIYRGDSAALNSIRADLKEVQDVITGGLLGTGLIYEQRELRHLVDALAERISQHDERLEELGVMKQYLPMLMSMHSASKNEHPANGGTAIVIVIIIVALIAFAAVLLFSIYARGGL